MFLKRGRATARPAGCREENGGWRISSCGAPLASGRAGPRAERCLRGCTAFPAAEDIPPPHPGRRPGLVPGWSPLHRCTWWGPRFWAQPSSSGLSSHVCTSLDTESGVIIIFFFFGRLAAYGVPGPGIRSETGLQPTLQLRQCWILNSLCWVGDGTCILVLPRGLHRRKFCACNFLSAFP